MSHKIKLLKNEKSKNIRLYNMILIMFWSIIKSPQFYSL